MAQPEAVVVPAPRSVFEFPWVRQLMALAGVAAAVAAGVVVALWSQQPNYTPLFTQLSERDAVAVAEALGAEQVPFRIDPQSGAVLVPGGKVRELRMRMAAQGLPQGSGLGLEILQQERSLGTSQFIETARYKHALEAELGRSIATLRNVERARVHLALPKRSVFIRERVKPSASVLVKLYQGRTLEPGQVTAVVHMVASSIPMLETGSVTVVDHLGRLLSGSDEDRGVARSAREFEHTRRVETDYAERVMRLLEPLVGVGKVRAEVTAVLDYTRNETTQETFDPEARVMRSEQVSEQESRGGDNALGIPGALSNQPPGAGTTDPAQAAEGAAQEPPRSQQRSATRNFEIDRVISHTRRPLGTIQRLSVAVIVDEQQALDDEGNAISRPYTAEELGRFTALVREAIGFDEARGDTVNLVNASFLVPTVEEVPEAPLWEQPWIWDLGKQIAGGLFVLLLLLFFVRPVMRGLAPPPLPAPSARGDETGGSGALTDDRVTLGGEQSNPALAHLGGYDEKLSLARSMVQEDPGRVANLVKSWVVEDG